MKSKYMRIMLMIPALLVFAGCVTTQQNNGPPNPDKAAIGELLRQWESTWNAGDIQGNLALWNDKAQIMCGNDRKIVNKTKYADILPERMKANPRITVGTPRIKIGGNKANATVNMSFGDFSAPTTFHLLKEKGVWSIMSWNY